MKTYLKCIILMIVGQLKFMDTQNECLSENQVANPNGRGVDTVFLYISGWEF